MSYTRLNSDDFVVSADSISATLWANGAPEITTFYTSSTQVASSAGNYYYNVYESTLTDIQFAVAYGNSDGSGSANYNNAVDGKSYTSTIYGQWQDLVIGDENTNFNFGGITATDIFALPVERARYKEKIFLGSLSLSISGSGQTITLTDNSNYVTAVQYCEAGRVFQLISGSQGVKNTSINSDGYTSASGSYGWLLPDIGTIVLNPLALAASAGSGGAGFQYSGSSSGSAAPILSPNAALYNAIVGGASFYLNSEETITSDYIFCRPRSSEYNYSENPSFISGSTGEVLYSDFINNPQTYITTVGLYNDTNELLAVAKLSRPLVKDFTKEALIRVKLDF